MRDARQLGKSAAVEPLAFHPVAQLKWLDSKLTMLTTPQPQLLAACALDTTGVEHGDGSRIDEANVPDEHFTGETLDVRPAAQFTVHVFEPAMLNAAAAAVAAAAAAAAPPPARALHTKAWSAGKDPT